MAQEIFARRKEPIRYKDQTWLKDVYLRSVAGTITLRTSRASEKSPTKEAK